MASKRGKLISLAALKGQINDAINDKLANVFLPDVVIPEVEELVHELFDKTISQWEGGAGAYRIDKTISSEIEPKAPTLQVKTSHSRKQATMHIFVKSYIWNLLDQGRPDRVTKKREKFVARADQRTIPGTLDVSGNRTYTTTVHVPKGATIKGFKPRGWTQLIVDDVKAQLGNKYPNIEFTFSIK